MDFLCKQFCFGTLLSVGINGTFNTWSTPITLTTNTLTHYVAVLDPNSTNLEKISLYLNGAYVGSVGEFNFADFPVEYESGRELDSDVAINYTSGLMKDLRIYNRALSSNEVTALYALESTPTRQDLTNGLVAWYHGGSTIDQSGNGNNLTSVNVTLTNGINGKANDSFYFNGSSSYMTAPMPVPTNNEFSWSFWIQPQNISNEMFLINMTDPNINGRSSPAIVYNNVTSISSRLNTIDFGSFSYNSGGTSIATPSNPVLLGQWFERYKWNKNPIH
jgi:Concanavalin A-like lectin/glucanases superfamily